MVDFEREHKNIRFSEEHIPNYFDGLTSRLLKLDCRLNKDVFRESS
jgi:hypothetical protein